MELLIFPQILHLQESEFSIFRLVVLVLCLLRILVKNKSLCSFREVVGKNESGIEGILTRLEKERNLSLGINLSGKGEINGDVSTNGSVPWNPMIVVCFLVYYCLHCSQIILMDKTIYLVRCLPAFILQKTASEIQEVDGSRSSGEYGQSRYQEAKSVSGNRDLNDSSTPETWRTWSMRRAGFTDEDFEGMAVSSFFFIRTKKY